MHAYFPNLLVSVNLDYLDNFLPLLWKKAHPQYARQFTVALDHVRLTYCTDRVVEPLLHCALQALRASRSEDRGANKRQFQLARPTTQKKVEEKESPARKASHGLGRSCTVRTHL